MTAIATKATPAVPIPDFLDGQNGEISEIRQGVESDDNQCPIDQDAGKILFRVLHLSADEAHVGPSIVDPQH
jgi:hypothetical protein